MNCSYSSLTLLLFLSFLSSSCLFLRHFVVRSINYLGYKIVADSRTRESIKRTGVAGIAGIGREVWGDCKGKPLSIRKLFGGRLFRYQSHANWNERARNLHEQKLIIFVGHAAGLAGNYLKIA